MYLHMQHITQSDYFKHILQSLILKTASTSYRIAIIRFVELTANRLCQLSFPNVSYECYRIAFRNTHYRSSIT
jgi:hypothetical protein